MVRSSVSIHSRFEMTASIVLRGTPALSSWKSDMSKPKRRPRRAAKKPVELYQPPPMIVNTGDPFMKI